MIASWKPFRRRADAHPSTEAEMAEIQAKLRSDLEIRAESPAPGSAVIVKDPATRRFYRFTPVQAAVLRRLDGETEHLSVAEAVTAECGTDVTEAQVDDFAGKLRSLLLLDHPSCWAKLEGALKPKNRFLGSILSIKIRAVNPDALIGRLEKKLAFCFTSTFALIVFAAVFAAVCISLANWESIALSIGTLFSLYSVPLVLAAAFVVMTIHEFAHGLALKHFGGKVEEMGLLFLYFIPAFYCNVDDAWLLKKRQRVLVTLAGGYIQLFIWALATIAWRLLAPETVLNHIMTVIVAFSGIQALFNFNPLIKLDGYYLLGDYLEIPNLRSRAFGYLRRILRRWLLTDRQSGTPVSVSGRERRIYLAYGTTAFLFTAGLIWFTFGRLAGWIVNEYQVWGMIAVAAFILMAVPVTGDGNASTKSQPPGGIVKRIKKVPRVLIILAILVVVGFFPWELKVTGDFTILASKKILVSPEVDGTLKAIYASEGQRVRANDVLAEMQNLELANTYEQTRGELETKKAELDLLKAGSRPEEIDRAMKLLETKKADMSTTLHVDQERRVLMDTVARKEAEVANAIKTAERSQKLFSDGLIPRADMEKDETALEVLRNELAEARGQLKVLAERTDRTYQVKRREMDEAQSALKLLQAGSRKEAIHQVETEVAKLEENKQNLARQLECLKIRSPMDGIVSTPYLHNRVGEYLERGNMFCEVVSAGAVIIDMPVPEKEIADVKVGFPITLKVRGYPKLSFEAKVKSISPVAVQQDTERMVLVQGELENADGTLKTGMTGVGKILCGKRLIAELTTRRAVRWLRTEFWEYLP
jgi:putative peptide zinc metalloprotease protein